MVTTAYFLGFLIAIPVLNIANAVAVPTSFSVITNPRDRGTIHSSLAVQYSDYKDSDIEEISTEAGHTDILEKEVLSTALVRRDGDSIDERDEEEEQDQKHDFALICRLDKQLSMECLNWGYYCTWQGKVEEQEWSIGDHYTCEEECSCQQLGATHFNPNCMLGLSGQVYCSRDDEDGTFRSFTLVDGKGSR